MLQFERQFDLFDPNLDKNKVPVVVVGLGTGGSWVVTGLAKLGLRKIHAIDFDIIEGHNNPNQVYGTDQVGMLKTTALCEIVETLTDDTHLPAIYTQRWEQASIDIELKNLEPFVLVAAVDSMAVRKEIWEWAKKHAHKVKFYVEARMGGEVLKLYTFPMAVTSHWDEYEKTLHGDSDEEIQNEEVRAASARTCRAGTTIDVALSNAGKIIRSIRHYLVLNKYRFETIADLRNDLTF